MNKILMTMAAAILFTFCNTFRRNNASSPVKKSTSNTANFTIYPTRTANSSDSFIITGSEYIPIEGRSETGTRADLEGAWVLDSLNGFLVPGKSHLNIQPTPAIPPGKEVRHDSTTTTKKIKGVTHTTTTVLIDRASTPVSKITPPQGTIYHIPAKPSISFYGANETFSGFTGCNKFSGRYSVAGKDTISLQGAAASTKMVCIGDYDEEAFLNALRKVNSFRGANGHLQLLEGKKVLLVFARKEQ